MANITLISPGAVAGVKVHIPGEPSVVSDVFGQVSVPGKFVPGLLAAGFTYPPRVSAISEITATAGGGQANAVLLTRAMNRVTVVASPGDSVKLPLALPGNEIKVINAGSNSLNLYPNTGEKINALANDNPFAIPAGKMANVYCASTKQWHSIITA